MKGKHTQKRDDHGAKTLKWTSRLSKRGSQCWNRLLLIPTTWKTRANKGVLFSRKHCNEQMGSVWYLVVWSISEQKGVFWRRAERGKMTGNVGEGGKSRTEFVWSLNFCAVVVCLRLLLLCVIERRWLQTTAAAITIATDQKKICGKRARRLWRMWSRRLMMSRSHARANTHTHTSTVSRMFWRLVSSWDPQNRCKSSQFHHLEQRGLTSWLFAFKWKFDCLNKSRNLEPFNFQIGWQLIKSDQSISHDLQIKSSLVSTGRTDNCESLPSNIIKTRDKKRKKKIDLRPDLAIEFNERRRFRKMAKKCWLQGNGQLKFHQSNQTQRKCLPAIVPGSKRLADKVARREDDWLTKDDMCVCEWVFVWVLKVCLSACLCVCARKVDFEFRAHLFDRQWLHRFSLVEFTFFCFGGCAACAVWVRGWFCSQCVLFLCDLVQNFQRKILTSNFTSCVRTFTRLHFPHIFDLAFDLWKSNFKMSLLKTALLFNRRAPIVQASRGLFGLTDSKFIEFIFFINNWLTATFFYHQRWRLRTISSTQPERKKLCYCLKRGASP